MEDTAPESEAVAEIETDGPDEIMFEAAVARPVIFISHSCLVVPDRSIALRLYQDLSTDCEVYVNTAEPKRHSCRRSVRPE